MGPRGRCLLSTTSCFLLLMVTLSWAQPLSKRKPLLPLGRTETLPLSHLFDQTTQGRDFSIAEPTSESFLVKKRNRYIPMNSLTFRADSGVVDVNWNGDDKFVWNELLQQSKLAGNIQSDQSHFTFPGSRPSDDNPYGSIALTPTENSRDHNIDFKHSEPTTLTIVSELSLIDHRTPLIPLDRLTPRKTNEVPPTTNHYHTVSLTRPNTIAGIMADTTPSFGPNDPNYFSESEVSGSSPSTLNGQASTQLLRPLTSYMYPQARGGEEDIIWIVTTKRPQFDYENLKKTHSIQISSPSSIQSTPETTTEFTRASLLNPYVTQPSSVSPLSEDNTNEQNDVVNNTVSGDVHKEYMPTDNPSSVTESVENDASTGIDANNYLFSDDNFEISSSTFPVELPDHSVFSTESSHSAGEVTQGQVTIGLGKPVLEIDNVHDYDDGSHPEILALEDYYDAVNDLRTVTQPIPVTFEGETSFAPLQEDLRTSPVGLTTTEKDRMDSSYDTEDLFPNDMDGNISTSFKTFSDVDQSLVYQSNNENNGKSNVPFSIKNEPSSPLSFGKWPLPSHFSSSKPVNPLDAVSSIFSDNSFFAVPVSTESLNDSVHFSVNDILEYLTKLNNFNNENDLNRLGRSSKMLATQSPLWMVGHLVLPRNTSSSNSTLAVHANKRYFDRISHLEEPQLVEPTTPNRPLNVAQILRLIFPPSAGLDDQAYSKALLRRTHNLLYKIWITSNNKENDVPTVESSQVRVIIPRVKYSRTKRQVPLEEENRDSNGVGIDASVHGYWHLASIPESLPEGKENHVPVELPTASRLEISNLHPSLMTPSQTPFTLRGNILELLPAELPQLNPIWPTKFEQTDLPVDLRPIVSKLPSTAQLRGELEASNLSRLRAPQIYKP